MANPFDALLQEEQELARRGKPSPDITNNDARSLGVLGTLTDVGKGIIDGGLDAVEEIHEIGHAAVNWLDDGMGMNAISDEYSRWLPDLNVESTAGKLASGLTKFTLGMVGAGKVLKGAKILQGATKGASIARSMVQGGMADFAMFSPNEDRLSDLVENFPALRNPVTAYLSADEDDGQMEGRLKNVVEGMFMGGITEAFMKGVRVYKASKKVAMTGGAEAAQKFLNEAAPEVFEELSKAVDPTGLRVISKANGMMGTVVDTTEEGLFKVVYGDSVEEIVGKEGLNIIPRSKGMTDTAALAKLGDRVVSAELLEDPKLLEIARKSAQDSNLGTIKESIEETLTRPDWTPAPFGSDRVINLDYFDGTEEVAKVIQGFEDASTEAIRARVGTETWEDVGVKSVNYVQELLGDPSGAISKLADLGDASLDMAGKAHGIATLVTTIGSDINAISTLLRSPDTATPLLKVQLVHRLQLLDEVVLHHKAVKTGVARALNSFKKPLGIGKMLDMEQIEQLIGDSGGHEVLDRLAGRLAQTSPKDIAKTMAASKGKLLWALNNELWINNVLSGVKTSVVNFTSTLANAAAYPLSKMAGGMLTGDTGLVREGANMFYAYGHFLRENVTMMAKAFKHGQNFLDASASVLDKPFRAWNHETMGIKYAPLAKIVDAFGTVINLPSRSLMAADEFFKHMVYRGEFYSTMLEKGTKMGLQGDSLDTFVKQSMSKAYSVVKTADGTEVLGKAVFKDALDVAAKVTFTTKLPPGSLGKNLSDMTMAHPYLRMALPFVRTPTNILKTSGEYTPFVAPFMQGFRETIKKGGRDKAIAMGKVAVGSGLWATGMFAAASGHITGGGPRDSGRRNMLYEAGWQPYSFKFKDADGRDKYYSFARIDPFASFFGICGDVRDIAGQLGNAELQDIATMAGVALSKNLTSKTYLRGLSETIAALSDPDANFGQFLKQQASAYVPLSSFMAGLKQVKDDDMREVEGLLDHIKSRLPGFSETLPLKRSWVTGMPLKMQEGLGFDFASPFATSEVTTKTQEELARLNYGFSPPARSVRGVKLTPDQYSAYCQLHGTTKINGLTMLESLEKLMDSDKYDIERNRVKDDIRPDGVTSHRIALIKKVIGAYRMRAERALILSDESLRQGIIDYRRTKGAWRSGDQDKIDALDQLKTME